MSSVLSERDRAIGAYCATARGSLRTAPERTMPRTGTPFITSVPMRAFLKRATTAALVITLFTAQPAAGAEVTANDSIDAFEISGSVILDGSFAEAREAAACTNCHWRVIRICAAGTLEDRRGCLGFACDSADDIAEVWRADAVTAPPSGDPLWTYRGLVCLEQPPVPAATMQLALRDHIVRWIPPLTPASLPAGQTLTGLPTFFRAGQPAQFVASDIVAGVGVVLHATPTWTWDFGHGRIETSVDPGSFWPRGSVRHTYPKRGIFRVRVTATWNATFDAGGLLNLPVDGVVTQSTWFDLRVREARRFITHPKGV